MNKLYYLFYFCAVITLLYNIIKDPIIRFKNIYDKNILNLSMLFYLYIFLISIIHFNLIVFEKFFKFLSIFFTYICINKIKCIWKKVRI